MYIEGAVVRRPRLARICKVVHITNIKLITNTIDK